MSLSPYQLPPKGTNNTCEPKLCHNVPSVVICHRIFIVFEKSKRESLPPPFGEILAMFPPFFLYQQFQFRAEMFNYRNNCRLITRLKNEAHGCAMLIIYHAYIIHACLERRASNRLDSRLQDSQIPFPDSGHDNSPLPHLIFPIQTLLQS